MDGSLDPLWAGADGDLQLAQASDSPFGEPIGKVAVAKGGAFVLHPDGTRVSATEGGDIYQGDVVQTGGDGSIGLVFADNTTFSLAENGEMAIDELVYDPGAQEGKMAVDILQGVFTFVSGQISKTGVEAMVINTPVATIGIRGTSGGGRAAPEGTSNTITLLPDPDGTVGEMTIGNDGGVQVLSLPNQTTQMFSAFIPPANPVVLPAAVVDRLYAAAKQSLPEAGPPDDAGDEGGEGGEETADGEGEGGEGEPGDEGDLEGEGDLAADGELTDGPVDEEIGPEGLEGEFDGPVDGEGEFGPETRQALAEAQALEAALEAGPAGDGLEDAAMRAAVDTMEQALLSGESLDGAMEAAKNAAIEAARAEALAQGVSEAEFEAGRAAFEQALASGASLEEAFAAADQAGSELNSGDVGGPGDTFTVSQGPGPGPGGDPFGPGGPGNFGNFGFGPGAGPGPGPDYFAGTDDPFGDFGQFDPFAFGTFDPFAAGYFQEPGLTIGDDNVVSDFNVVSEFAQTLTGTTGDDVLIGNDESTSFRMTQGTSLGGNDVIDGKGGVDEITLKNLSGITGKYDPSTKTITYEGSVNGTIAMTSVEQIYADNGTEARVRLGFEPGDTGIGYILSGTVDGSNTADVLTVANGTNLGGTIGSVSTGNVLGSIIFGNDGDDTITGSEAGDLLFGGTGNDTINGGSGEDELFGGAGSDTLDGGSNNDQLTGGAGSDVFVTQTGGSTDFVSDFEIGTDNIDVDDSMGVFTYDFFSNVMSHTSYGHGFQWAEAGSPDSANVDLADTGVSPFDGRLMSMVDDSGNLTGTTGADLLLVSGTTSGKTISGGAGADRILSNAQGGNTFDGGAGADTIVGGSGNDTVIGGDGGDSLKGGAGADTFRYAATTEFGDTISDFESFSGDKIDYNVIDLVANNTAPLGGSDAAVASLNGSQTAGTHIYIVGVSAGGLAAADAVAAINSGAGGTFNAENANDVLLFAVKDGGSGNTKIWHADVDGTGANTTIEAGDLTEVAHMTGDVTLNGNEFV